MQNNPSLKELWSYYNNPVILNPPSENPLIPENHLRFKKLFQEIKEININKILDIGCNDGFFLSKIKAKEKYGVDVAKHILGKARSKGVKTFYTDLNLRKKLPFKNAAFDFILCNAVLEHILYPEFVVKEIKRLLKKGGYAYIITDSADTYIDRLGLSKVKENKRFNEHLYHFTKVDLFNLFSEFKLIKYFSFGFFIHMPFLKEIYTRCGSIRSMFFRFNLFLSNCPLTKNLGALHFCLIQK